MALFHSSGADGAGALRIGSVLIDLKAPGVRFGKRSKFMSDEEWAREKISRKQSPVDGCETPEGVVSLGLHSSTW
jgi:hypothetical protein